MLKGVARALVVAAHPDDEVLGCGGTIARLTDAGAAVRVMFLAEGVTARYAPDQFDDPAVVAASRQRNENAVRALAGLGVAADDVLTETRPCCRLDTVPLLDLTKQIEAQLADFRPNLLLTHADADVNVDHCTAHRAVLAAVRPVSEAAPATVLAFEVLSSTEWNPSAPFHANVFHDITDTIDRKIDALIAYEDECHDVPHPRSEHGVRGLAAFRGVQSGFPYAEAFTLIRNVSG